MEFDAKTFKKFEDELVLGDVVVPCPKCETPHAFQSMNGHLSYARCITQ